MKESPIRPDVCAHLLKVCEYCQHNLLDSRGITCLFDVDSGTLPATQCEAIGDVVKGLMHQICESKTEAAGGRITVALHHRDDAWMLAVRDQGIRTCERTQPFCQDRHLQNLALPLHGTYHTRAMPDGVLTAVAFLVEPQADGDHLADWDISSATDENIIKLEADPISLPTSRQLS